MDRLTYLRALFQIRVRIQMDFVAYNDDTCTLISMHKSVYHYKC